MISSTQNCQRILVVCLCLIGLPYTGYGQTISKTGFVVWVMDGDTFIVRFPTEENENVAEVIRNHPRGWPVDPRKTDEYVANLIGVDAAGWQEERGNCYALEAAEFLNSKIFNKQVNVTWDSQDKIGGRGRILLYVEVDGEDVNAAVIQHGFGWVPRRFPADRKTDYLQLEQEARDAQRGMWGKC